MRSEQLQFGDIVMVKSFSAIGWAIGTSFRERSPVKWYCGTDTQKRRPSNHNGVIGYDQNGQLCVFESLGNGVVRTPLDDYRDDVREGRAELKFARVAGVEWSSPMVCNGEVWLASKVGIKYDFRSYISHLWRTMLRLPPIFASGVQSESRFYCTEMVRKFLLHIDIFAPHDVDMDVLNNPMPTPFTVEKRIADGRLAIMEEWHG